MDILVGFLWVYAVLLLVGGFIGFKAGSSISLYMGIISSVLAFAGLFITKSNPHVGYIILMVLSALLAGVFLKRFLATKKVMPGGMMFLLSLVALFTSFLQYTQS